MRKLTFKFSRRLIAGVGALAALAAGGAYFMGAFNDKASASAEAAPQGPPPQTA